MHTMGLAFDIALVNTPIETVYEIRDVLIRMRNAGEILFIGERRQLVFHVVPHPSRLGHFHQVYAQALGYQPVTDRAQVVALSARRGAAPSVSADVIAVLPSGRYADEWWAASHDHADITVDVVAPVAPPEEPAPVPAGQVLPPEFLVVLAIGGIGLTAVRQRASIAAPAVALLRQP
jgi:hypothetical protein